MKNFLFVSGAALLLSLAGCARDPAKDAPAAAVSSPTSAMAATTPMSAGTAGSMGSMAAGEKLAIDPTTSKINWTGSKVTGSHPGGFKEFSGTITLVEGKPEASKVEVDIDTKSIWSDNEKLTGHLQSPDFFDVAKFPKATFVSTSIVPNATAGATHTIKGNLTLHGVTKEIAFPATINVDDKQVTAKSKFSLKRTDFGIVYTGKADDLIREDVLMELDLVAKRG